MRRSSFATILRRVAAAWLPAALLAMAAAQAAETTPPADDPEVAELLESLEPNTGLYLPKFKTAGEGRDLVSGFSTKGPDVRDYGNKLAYAPDRGTGMYCGANHGAPHRLNDVSEFHLGSNTWRLLLPPAGGDHGRVDRAHGAIRQNKDVEQNKAFLREWYTEHVAVKDGYLQTTANGGPVGPWHTWDGIAYDAAAKKLLWAVLDTDEVLKSKVRAYAEHTGQDAGKLLEQFRPGTGLYAYDPAANRWSRALTDGPRPYLRGMGGSLIYVPEWKKTIWYCAAQNVSPNDFAMWTYDAIANKWEDLKPNGGRSLFDVVHKDKAAPSSEVQMAYSPKHKKLVAVLGDSTYVYDLDRNEWKGAVVDERNQAHDASTVFSYDSVNDVFLFLNRLKGQYDPAVELRAFRLDTNKWETLSPKGELVRKVPYGGLSSYFDPAHNVFVVYNDTDRMWVYRHATR
ncbi:MAG: hypothetical protein WED34_08010 [Planctomycetales bacterium]